MRWTGHVARVRERRGAKGFWWGSVKEKFHLEDPVVDGRIILKWIFRKWDVGAWTGLVWLRIGAGGGTCECGK